MNIIFLHIPGLDRIQWISQLVRDGGVKERQLFGLILFLLVHDGVRDVQDLDHGHLSVLEGYFRELELNVLKFTGAIVLVDFTFGLFFFDNLVERELFSNHDLLFIFRVAR